MEDEKEVAPIIVIQTPDPLLRLQVVSLMLKEIYEKRKYFKHVAFLTRWTPLPPPANLPTSAHSETQILNSYIANKHLDCIDQNCY